MNHYDVWDTEPTGESNGPTLIVADNQHAAAESWGRSYDMRAAGGPFIADGHVAIIMVRDIRTRALYRFKVRGKLLPIYQAQDITGVPT